MNPLELPEILELCLSYLENKDLLKARLVNHAWNLKSISTLRKAGNLIHLSEKNIQSYVDFIKTLEEAGKTCWSNSNSSGGSDNFFFLKYDIQLELSHLTLHAMQDIMKALSELLDIFPATVEKFIYMSAFTSSFDPNIVTVIEKLSKGLKSLAISCPFLNTPTDPAELTLKCPKLKSIEIGFIEPRFGGKLINSAPALHALTLMPPCDIAIYYNQYPFWNEYLVQLLNEFKNDPLHVSSLCIHLGDEASCEGLAQVIFTKLEEINIEMAERTVGTNLEGILRQFLMANSSTLKRLNISEAPGTENSELLNCLPEDLPLLSTFGFYSGQMDLNEINPGCCEWVSALLPTLTTIQIDSNVLFSGSGQPITPADGRPLSLMVSTLSLLILAEELESRIPINEATYNIFKFNIQQLSVFYPLINRLELTFHRYKNCFYYDEARILRIIFENLPNLRTLLIVNYEEDWMARVCEDSGAAVKNLQSLETLSIGTLSAGPLWDDIYDQSEYKPMLSLTTLLQCLPKLRNIKCPNFFETRAKIEELMRKYGTIIKLSNLNIKNQHL